MKDSTGREFAIGQRVKGFGETTQQECEGVLVELRAGDSRLSPPDESVNDGITVEIETVETPDLRKPDETRPGKALEHMRASKALILD